MKKNTINEVARFQAIAGIQAVGSLREDMTTNEAGMGGKSLADFFPGVDKGDMDNSFFINLFDALDNYFEANAEELTNMDAKYLAHICRQASKVIKGRSGN